MTASIPPTASIDLVQNYLYSICKLVNEQPTAYLGISLTTVLQLCKYASTEEEK